MGELPGLQKALKLVDEEADRVHARGLSTFTFFFGMATCVVTAFLIGRFPASVWIVYAAEALAILGYRLYVDSKKTNPHTMLYFLDLCWVTNFIIALLAFVILFDVLDEVLLGDVFPHLSLAKRYPDVGRIICLFATGPLGCSVILLNNALVLHDIELFSGCFIHLWPSFTTLAVRAHPALVMASYPGHFDSFTGFNDTAHGAGILELVKLGAMAYFVWWVPFTIWMLVDGRHQSPKKTGWDTVYFGLVMSNGAVRSTLGIRWGDEDAIFASASQVGPVLKYMVIHATLVMVSLVWSALCYKYMNLHYAFCILLVCVAMYNASKRYEWMLTDRYSRAIRKHIEKEFPDEATKPKLSNKEDQAEKNK